MLTEQSMMMMNYSMQHVDDWTCFAFEIDLQAKQISKLIFFFFSYSFGVTIIENKEQENNGLCLNSLKWNLSTISR